LQLNNLAATIEFDDLTLIYSFIIITSHKYLTGNSRCFGCQSISVLVLLIELARSYQLHELNSFQAVAVMINGHPASRVFSQLPFAFVYACLLQIMLNLFTQ
jgi:hypothetical protein